MADKEIKANKVYHIKVLRQSINTLSFDLLTVDDWTAADAIESNPVSSYVTYTADVPAPAGTASVVATNFNFTPSATATDAPTHAKMQISNPRILPTTSRLKWSAKLMAK